MSQDAEAGVCLRRLACLKLCGRKRRIEDKAQLLQVRVRLHDTDLGLPPSPHITYGKEGNLEF